jgi:hypothetical protein
LRLFNQRHKQAALGSNFFPIIFATLLVLSFC